MASETSMCTIDFVLSLLAPIVQPVPSLFVPLTHLALNADIHSRTLHYLLLYPLTTVILHVLLFLNARIASGPPRPVDWSSEVVLITGGAGGLGRVIAETYAIRGIDVAVADIADGSVERKKMIEGMGESVRYFQCDLGAWNSVMAMKKQILKEVCVLL